MGYAAGLTSQLYRLMSEIRSNRAVATDIWNTIRAIEIKYSGLGNVQNMLGTMIMVNFVQYDFSPTAMVW